MLLTVANSEPRARSVCSSLMYAVAAPVTRPAAIPESIRPVNKAGRLPLVTKTTALANENVAAANNTGFRPI